MAQIRLKNVSKRFDNEYVVNNMNLTVKDGSFTVLVGPSGCGKSTTLRMIAGLEQVSEGEIWVDDECVNDVSPGKRDVAMVFQNYALYPTMTVKGNIEFGLTNRKVPKRERESLINDIAAIVGLENHLYKKPQTLSGGQRQRVALARAMVKKPKVFILDEPLSNLDAKLRSQMRTELIQLHQRLGTTFIYVTHDQVEAMSMGDEIVLLNKGEIQQNDSPMNVYHYPVNVFSAEFIGTPAMNVFLMEKIMPYTSTIEKDAHYVGFRPEHAAILTTQPYEDSHSITLQGQLLTRETLGSETIYQIKHRAGNFTVKSFLPPIEENNKNVFVSIPYEKLYFFDENKKQDRDPHWKPANSLTVEGM
ncbi:ABC transporter ATP-binding protein [Salibacterium salarium]|uniref:ABC transporter ATP-binding protein n=1 Tax=Salibacterium salarium TaxID=284579 RepID=A0A3R9PHA3_9BACI|nr:ABC transporter ATP-binding protein [Salibacterium salarium]RSL30633.1 ABC transporter ATP-binding protein [Salibacterium salarium]